MHTLHILCAFSALVASTSVLAMNNNNAPAPTAKQAFQASQRSPYLTDAQMVGILASRASHNREELERIEASLDRASYQPATTQNNSTDNDNNAPAPTTTYESPTQRRIEEFVANAHRCMASVRKGSVESELTATPLDDQTMNLETTLDEIQERRARVQRADSFEAIHSSVAFQAKYSYATTSRNPLHQGYTTGQIECIEEYKKKNEIEALFRSTERTIALVRQATDNAYAVHAEGNRDYTVEEDYEREPKATLGSSVSMSDFLREGDHPNNANFQATAPERITDANKLLKIELKRNPAQTFEILVRYFNQDSTRYTMIDEQTGDTPLHKVIQLASKNKGIEHTQVTYICIAAALAVGADKEAPNSVGKTPMDLALESDDEILIQLITLENPSKEAMIALAFELKLESLLGYLIE